MDECKLLNDEGICKYLGHPLNTICKEAVWCLIRPGGPWKGADIEIAQPPTSESPDKPGWILTAMNLIEETFPLDLEYETDARHIWPKRWERLRRQIECKLQVPEQDPIKEPS